MEWLACMLILLTFKIFFPLQYNSRLNDKMWDDGNTLGPKEIHKYLSRVMYNRRNKFDPLWNTLILGGVKKGVKYLGMVYIQSIHCE